MLVLLADSGRLPREPWRAWVAAGEHEVTRCEDVASAWRVCQDAAPALLVLDWDLPGGGLELCRRIHARAGDEGPFVLLLGSAHPEVALHEARAAGADDVLLPPFGDDELAVRLALAERRVAEDARWREEHRSYMDLLAEAPDLIQTVAPDGQLLYVNRAWCDALGYEDVDVADLSFFDVVVPEFRERMRKAFRWVLRGRGIRRLQTELRSRGGRVMSVEGSFTPRYRGKVPTSVRVILRDVSRQKRAETVLRNVLEGTSATTGEDFFRSLTRHLSGALGVRHALVAELVPGSEDVLRTLAVWSGDGFRPNREFELAGISPSPLLQGQGSGGGDGDPSLFPGARFLAELGADAYLGVPLTSAAGEAIGLLCVLDDGPMRTGPDALRILSTFAQRAGAEVERLRSEEERRELDRRMQESQKLESMGVLAGGIAHDFNNLLTSIMGYASLAQRSAIPGSAAHRYLADIEKASRRAADLAMQMLAYSGKGQFVVQPLDLCQVIRETTEFLKTDIMARGVVVRRHLPAGIHAVEGDVTQVRQVIMNLLLNAAQAMEPEGGTVDIRVTEREVQESELATCYVGSALPAGPSVVMTIADTGRGVDAETARRIFDPFFTTKTGGRGLGLAAVVGIVRGHNGALKVESEPGVGTRVTVYLRPSEKPAMYEEASRQPVPARGEGLILVVDDEPGLLQLATDILESGGYRALTASNGAEGVEVLRGRADEIDAVLLDMTMPVMGGVEAFHAMREIRPDVRVVVSSGYTQQEAINRFPGDAPMGFIQKPYTAAELLETIGSVTAAGALRS